MKKYTLHGTLALLLVLALCLCLLPAAFAEELNVSDAGVFDADSMGKLIFDPNGGEGSAMEPIVKEIGSTITLPDCTFMRSGYNFAGWNTEPDGSGTSYGNVNNPYGASYTFRRGEVTLYAKWARALAVTLDPNGGTPATPIMLNGSQGSSIDFPTADNDGYGNTVGYQGVTRFDRASGRYYEFTGWNMVKDGTKADNESTHIEPGTSAVRLNADVTVYAEWRKPVTIRFLANGGSGYMEDETACFAGDAVILAENRYTRDSEALAFLGWNTKRDGSGTAYSDGEMVIIEDNLTLYAQWADAVVVSFDGNGATEGYMENQVVPANVLATLNKNAFRRDSYSFVSWNTKPDGSGTSYANGDIVMLDRSVYLYAQWEKSAFTVKFYDGDALIQTILVSKGEVIELINYDMTYTDKVLIGWSLVPGRNVATYTVGQGYTPTKDTTFYAVSGDAVRITYVINGDSSNTQIVARSTPTALNSFESMGIEPPAMKYFDCWRDSKYYTYSDRQTVSLNGDIVLTAEWREAEEPAPAAPSQVTVLHHLVNYGSDVLRGHSGQLSGLNDSMEYYTGNGTWIRFYSSSLGVKRPYDFEIRYAEVSSPKTPHSESVFRPMYSFESLASDPVDNSTSREEIYSYNVNIYSVRPSGAKTLVDSNFTDEGRALQDVLSTEEIYFLLDYPDGITQNSNILTLMHDGKPVEIEQLSEGILGKANSFTNPEFTLTVEDRLYGLVELSDTAPKAGDTITATVSYTNLVGKPVYRWLRDGIPCTEFSRSNSYTLTGADLMHRLSCEVKSQNNTPQGTIVSEQTSQVIIDSHEAYVSQSGTTNYVGYFEGVTSDMEYSLNDGVSFRSVTDMGALFDDDNHILYVTTPGVYIFRYRNETDPEYWEAIDNEIEGWYIVGYNVSTSSTDSGSGTVTFRNGTTTLSSSSRITDSSGRVIIQGDGTNRWKVRMGSNTNINMVVRPSGSSSSGSSSSPSPYVTYAHVSLNGGEYVSFSGERTITVEPVNQNKIYTIVFNKSMPSPKTDIILEIPSGTKQIEEEAFAGGGFSYVRIQNNAITIGSRAFADCPNLSVVEIPASVRFIADDAFENDGDLIIGGIRGSVAESYANRKGYSFVAMATAP